MEFFKTTSYGSRSLIYFGAGLISLFVSSLFIFVLPIAAYFLYKSGRNAFWSYKTEKGKAVAVLFAVVLLIGFLKGAWEFFNNIILLQEFLFYFGLVFYAVGMAIAFYFNQPTSEEIFVALN